MNQINAVKFGLASGFTGILLYSGCVILMLVLGQDGTTRFFNRLLHGIDVTTLMRMDVPPGETAIGLIETFFLFWVTGACIAIFYNALSKTKTA